MNAKSVDLSWKIFIHSLGRHFKFLCRTLDERQRRWWKEKNKLYSFSKVKQNFDCWDSWGGAQSVKRMAIRLSWTEDGKKEGKIVTSSVASTRENKEKEKNEYNGAAVAVR